MQKLTRTIRKTSKKRNIETEFLNKYKAGKLKKMILDLGFSVISIGIFKKSQLT